MTGVRHSQLWSTFEKRKKKRETIHEKPPRTAERTKGCGFFFYVDVLHPGGLTFHSHYIERSREKSRDPPKIANYTNGTMQLSSILKYRRYVSVKISMQNTEKECAARLLEFETRLTHIFTGSTVSIIRSTRGSFGRNEKRGEEEGREKRATKNSERTFPRETFTSATLILTAGEFFTGKPAARERKNFARVHVVREVTSFSSWIRRCGLINLRAYLYASFRALKWLKIKFITRKIFISYFKIKPTKLSLSHFNRPLWLHRVSPYHPRVKRRKRKKPVLRSCVD